jgi:hypothetical protein
MAVPGDENGRKIEKGNVLFDKLHFLLDNEEERKHQLELSIKEKQNQLQEKIEMQQELKDLYKVAHAWKNGEGDRGFFTFYCHHLK